MSRQKLNEALARKMHLQKKKVIASGNVSGWMLNDKMALTCSGHYDKGRNTRKKDFNALDKMR